MVSSRSSSVSLATGVIAVVSCAIAMVPAAALGQSSAVVPLTVRSAGAGVARDTFGVHEDATYCIDGLLGPGFNEEELPPPPPYGVMDGRFIGHRSGSSCLGTGARLHLQEPWKLDTFKLRFQPDDAGYPMSITWPPGLASDGWDTLTMFDTYGGEMFTVDMLQETTLVVTPDSIGMLFIVGRNNIGPPPAGSVTLIAPNGGETWEGGSHREIAWTSTNVANVTLAYTTNNGGSWSEVATRPSPGTYEWIVPYTPSAIARVRVSDASDSAVADASDATFAIVVEAGPLTRQLVPLLISDNGTKTARDTFGVHVYATYCNDDTLEPGLIEKELPPVPPVGAMDGRFVDHRSPWFCINSGLRLHLQEPAKLDTFRLRFQPGDGGYPMTIRWPAGLAEQGWDSLVIQDVFGGFLISNDMLADTVLVVTNPALTMLDIIGKNSLPPPSMTLVSPNGGEGWILGSYHDVVWNSYDISGQVAIDFSTDAGATWTVIDTAASSPYSWHLPDVLSSQCLVRVHDVANSLVGDQSDGVFSITTGEAWRYVPLSVGDGGGGFAADTFGVHQSATYCIDGLLDPGLVEEELPPPPPPTSFLDARFVDHRAGSFCLGTGVRLHLQEPGKLDTFKLRFQPGEAGYPITVRWPAGLVAQGWETLMLLDDDGGSIYMVDMLEETSLVVSDDTVASLLIVGLNSFDGGGETVVDLLAGWSLLSLPYRVEDRSKEELFPSSVTQAFIYDGGYVPMDTLPYAAGFWVKFDEPQGFEFSGMFRFRDTVDVEEGWNLVGSISDAIPVANITSIPGGIVTSNFFGYHGSYHPSGTIQPGRGYWVKASASGKIVLHASGAFNAASRIRIEDTGEMPPPPPVSSGATAGGAGVPAAFAVSQNYPNPFNPTTRFDVTIPASSRLKATVHNLAGETVAVIADGTYPAGVRTFEWNAGSLPSGAYFLRISFGSVVELRKLMLLK